MSKNAERMGASAISADTITPVRPSPPTVAAKRSGRSAGPVSIVSPEERRSASARTWLPKVPAVSWFLPWTSLAMAPPRVTCLVPGVTGRNQPRGTASRRIASRLMPASARRMPRSQSALIMRSRRRVAISRPPSLRQRSP